MPEDRARKAPTDTQNALLRDPDPAVRFNAGLDRVKVGDAAGVPALIGAFAHESGVVRLFHAGRALVELGAPAVPALEAALADDRPRVRVDAAIVLGRIVPARREALLPIAIAALGDEDREAAGDALTFLGEAEARSAIPALIRLLEMPATLKDPEAWSGDFRVGVAALLGHLAAPRESEERADPAALAALIAALRADAPSARWAAARALGQLADAARDAVAALAGVARDEGEAENARVEAAYALAVMGEPTTEAEAMGRPPGPLPVAPALLAMLASGNAWVRLFAARILGEGGEPVVPSGDREPPHNLWVTAAAPNGRCGQSKSRRRSSPVSPPRSPIPMSTSGATPPTPSRAMASAPRPRSPRSWPRSPRRVWGRWRRRRSPGSAAQPCPRSRRACRERRSAARGLAAYALRLIDLPEAQAALAAGEEGQAPSGNGPSVFAPTVEQFFVTVPIEWTTEKRAAFDALYQATLAPESDSVPTVAYALPFPRHEFLRYLVEEKRLLLHGTDRADLEVLQPLRWSTDGSDHGNVSGVYADRDPIRPIYFAIVHRARSTGLNNGFFDLNESGEGIDGEAPTCERRFYRLAVPVIGLPRDPWRSGCVYILPQESFVYWNEWTSRAPVRPLMRLLVTPEDLPLRDQVWGVDWRQPVNTWVGPDQPFPFLTDTQGTPVRAPRSLCR